MGFLGFVREFIQLAGAGLALILTYYYIKEIRSKRPNISIKIKKVSVSIGRDLNEIKDEYTEEIIDVRESDFSEFRFNIEFQNKGHTNTHITDFKVRLSNGEPKKRIWSFTAFEIPKRDILEKLVSFSLYCHFTQKNNPITLEFTTLDGNIIQKIVEIPKESIIHEADFYRYLGH